MTRYSLARLIIQLPSMLGCVSVSLCELFVTLLVLLYLFSTRPHMNLR